MKRVFLLLLMCLAAYTRGQAQFIEGVVKDKYTGKPLPFCTLRISGEEGTTADGNGEFRIKCPGGPIDIIASCIGYKGDTVSVTDPAKHCLIRLYPEEKRLDEVVVTGVSKATDIRESPVAIISIPQKQIQRTTESNIIDALVKNSPGLSAVKTGPNISKPFIRGLGYNRVLTLYDGVRQEGQQWGDEHGIEVDGYNIEKAEVIKGPASLLYGSDALAGVVSLMPYIPRDRDSVFKGKVFSEYQSNNGLVGQGLRLGYSDGKWICALRGSYRIAKNYTNRIDGRIYNTSFRENNASILLGYENKNGFTHLNFTLYDNLQGIPDGSRDSLSRRFTKQVYESDKDTVQKRTLVSEEELNGYDLSPLHQDIRHMRAYSNSHFRLGAGDADLLLAFQQNTRKEFNHPTEPTVPGMSVKLQTYNYGLRYNAPSFVGIEASVGVNGMYQVNTNVGGTTFPIPDYNLFDAGGYVFGKWKHDRWCVSGGVRIDSRSIHGKELFVRDAPNSFSQQVFVPDTAGARQQFTSFGQQFTGVSSSVGGTWNISRRFSLKANVARGYRAPNISEIAANGLDPGAHIVYIGNQHFLPEFSFQQDLGAIIDVKDVSGSVSLFNNYMQNYIYLEQVVDALGMPLVLVPGNKTFQYRQGSAQLYGFEASVDLHPVTLKGFTWKNDLCVLYGTNTNSGFRAKGVLGEYLPFIPPPRLLSFITKEFSFEDRVIKEIACRAEIDHNTAQARYMALYQTETFTASYTLLNLGVDLDISYTSKKTLKVYCQVNNLLDVAYQSNLSRLKYFEYYASSPTGRYGIYGMGRNFCIKLVIDL